MTESPDPLAELVGRWPARFRHRRLLGALNSPGSADELSLALLHGMAEEQDEAGVFHSLLAEGRFDLADQVLTFCQTFDEAGDDSMREHLATARSRRQQELRHRLKEMAETAQAADLPFHFSLTDLEEQCALSWPKTAAALDELRSDLNAQVADLHRSLIERLTDEPQQDPAWVTQFHAILESGNLRIAEQMLDHPEAHASGPSMVLPMMQWTWTDPPEEVLRWHLEPTLNRPLSFAPWETHEGSSAYRLLDAYEALGNGGMRAAEEFATNLDSFLLGTEVTEGAPLHQVEGGHLTTLTGVYADPEIKGFHPTGTVNLFVANPETTAVPRMDELGPFIAVGPSLQPYEYTDRVAGALLGLRSLLRLVTVRQRRPIALLRLLGSQWPLSAFAFRAGWDTSSPDSTEEARARLAWVMDLTGLGDLTTTLELALDTAMHPGLIQVMLDFHQAHARADMRWRARPRWSEDSQTVAAVEREVLRHLSADGRTAFWAALVAGQPHQPVAVDDILLVCGMFTPSELTSALEQRIRRGCLELADSPLARESSADKVRFVEAGVFPRLAELAEQRLPSAIRLLVEEAEGSEDAGRTPASAWELHRHALTEEVDTYRSLTRGDGAPSDEALDVLDRIREATPKTTAGAIDGECDLVTILGEVGRSFRERYPRIRLTVETLETGPVCVSPELVEVVLYELFANAADALGDAGGAVLIRAESLYGDVALDVQDSGPGIEFPAGSEHLVFRPNRTTRGQGRGAGLYRSRALLSQVGGELSLQARSSNHPVFQGAHLRAIFPGT